MQETWTAWEGSNTFPRQKNKPCNVIAWARSYQIPAVIAEVIQQRHTGFVIWRSPTVSEIVPSTAGQTYTVWITTWQQCNTKTFVCLTTPLNPWSLRSSWIWQWYGLFCEFSVFISITLHSLHKSESRILIGTSQFHNLCSFLQNKFSQF